MTTQSDSSLMQDVRVGRTEALATLFERHHVRLYRFCLNMTGNRQAAEDLVQDVFLRMLKYRRSFREGTAFAPWMFRIARNACADHLRRTPTPADHEPYDESMAAAEDGTGDGAETERADLIRRALLAVPATGREVLVLSRYELKSYEEIARALNCSVGAVKVRVHRALKQLRQAYLELSEETTS